MDETNKDPKLSANDVQSSHRAPILAELSDEIIELKTKIAALVRDNFGGDYRKAFAYYDPDQDGISSDELSQLLEEAGVGNVFTRSSWVSGILEKVDVDQNGRVSWVEFERIVKNT